MRRLIFLMLVSTLMACTASTEQLAHEGDWYGVDIRMVFVALSSALLKDSQFRQCDARRL